MSQTTRKELLVQLQHLRSETKEISRIYVANLQRDIVHLIDFLNEHPAPKTKNSRATNSLLPQLKEMKEVLDSVTLKPEKGRRKDLRKIEQAVRSLTKIAFSEKKTS